ncbi:MAG: helix-turn-helix domain-containing protein [Spirochaetales bacterium]|nr:helix-turn-helix domain-containing protein [Spirochaetales bacterium]
MGRFIKESEQLFDPEKAAADFTLAAGIDCIYAPLESHTQSYVNKSSSNCCSCSLCSQLDPSGKLQGRARCCETHRFAAYQAERFGGKYLYFCRFSLLHWASPIIRGGMLEGALISGPVMLFAPDSLYLEECQRKFKLNEAQVQKLKNSLVHIPKISTARANSSADTLFLIALSLCENDAVKLFADRDAFEQQSRIGEYLHHLKSMEGDKRSDMDYPMEKERQLLRYTSEGRKQEAGKLLNEILGTVLYTSGVQLEMVKSRILELAVLLSRAAVEGGADIEQIFGLNCHYLIRIRSLDSLEDLSAWTKRIMDRFIDLVFNLRTVQHTQKIIMAIRYVQNHYSEKISLNSTAESLQLSPSYFSRLFKQEMGIVFSEYVNDVRIEEARKQLISTNRSLGEIGFMCGFDDQSYFTRVFRKKTGLPPSRYRETGGRALHPS